MLNRSLAPVLLLALIVASPALSGTKWLDPSICQGVDDPIENVCTGPGEVKNGNVDRMLLISTNDKNWRQACYDLLIERYSANRGVPECTAERAQDDPDLVTLDSCPESEIGNRFPARRQAINLMQDGAGDFRVNADCGTESYNCCSGLTCGDENWRKWPGSTSKYKDKPELDDSRPRWRDSEGWAPPLASACLSALADAILSKEDGKLRGYLGRAIRRGEKSRDQVSAPLLSNED